MDKRPSGILNRRFARLILRKDSKHAVPRVNVERDRIVTLCCHCGRWYGDIPDRLAQGRRANCVSLLMFVISISCSLLKREGRDHLDGVLAQHEPQQRAIVIVPSNPGDNTPIGADTDQRTCRMPLRVGNPRLTTVRSLRIPRWVSRSKCTCSICQLSKSA